MKSGKLNRSINNVLKTFGLERTTSCDPYTTKLDLSSISMTALDAAKRIRGETRGPAIIIQGVMQRSGTVYTGELLRLHPDVQAFPNEIWEFPFLKLTGNFQNAQKFFFRSYKQNIGKLGENDFLPLFGAAMIDYLHSFIPENKRMLLKMPDVSFLSYFPVVFPFEDLLLLHRDGRDVVASTLKTWPKADFSAVCERWGSSTRLMLEFNKNHKGMNQAFSLIKYEDILTDPENFVRQACDTYGLAVDRYPFEKIDELPTRGSSTLGDSGHVNWEPKKAPKGFKPGGRWRKWSEKQKRVFNKNAGQALIDSGYAENMNW